MAYYVESGQTSTGLTVNGVDMYVSNGGTASRTTVKDLGRINVSSGGKVVSTTISSGGMMTVLSGAIMTSTIVKNQGELYISGGTLIGSSATVSGIRMMSGDDGRIFVRGQNTFVSSVLLYAGQMTISGANTVVSGAAVSGARTIIGSGGSLSSATLYGDAVVSVLSGGYALENKLISATARMTVYNGGAARLTQVSAGSVDVSSGGKLNSTTVSGGYVHVSSGGSVFSAYVSSGAHIEILRGASANTLRISSGAATTIQVASATRIVNGRYGDKNFTLLEGVLENFDLNSGCTVDVLAGGTAYLNHTTVSAGATLTVQNGGKVTGKIEIEEGAKVSAESDGVFEFDLTGRGPGEPEPLINNLSLIGGDPSFTILVSTLQDYGSYRLAAGAAGFNKTILVDSTEGFLGDFTVNGSFVSDGNRYSLSLAGDNLNFTISSAETDTRTNFMQNGVSQVLAWDGAQGKVGYMATNGNPAPSWKGIWEWSTAYNPGLGASEASLWKVVAAGHFSGSTVDYDGVLLYNGIGNTFAAWTNLNDPSYGYVSLCHVDGNFQTKCLGDFDNNGFDDVIIYNEKGSVGIVSDAASYHDVWHSDSAASNPWQLLGAGTFDTGLGQDSLLFKNTSNGHLYLWDNQGSSLATWNWRQTDIGLLASGWEFAAIGDFAGDGIDDIVLVNHNDNDAVFVWDDGIQSSQHYVGVLGAGFKIETVGDYDGDGREDLLLREYNTGWGGIGCWSGASATAWNDFNARIETNMQSQFTIVA